MIPEMTLLNYLFGGILALLAFLGKAYVSTLQKKDDENTKKIEDVEDEIKTLELKMVERFVSREDFMRIFNELKDGQKETANKLDELKNFLLKEKNERA